MRTAWANQLARRADRLRANGTRGWRARRAWETLTTAAQRDDSAAVEALRAVWLGNPRAVTWPDVARWVPTADVLAAAVAPGRTNAARAALGAFCQSQDLVPDKEIERVLFFVLTGQQERYEAADPDGTLLASGYRGATEKTRKALRDTMLGLGAVNLVRVIADRPDRPLTAAEAEYLTARLAGAGDWAGLWRLVPTIPFASTVRAATLFGDWRPADDAGRQLLDRLAGADPALVTAVAAAAVTQLPTSLAFEYSFSADGTELVVRHSKGVSVIEPRAGRQLASYQKKEQFGLLALGSGAFVYIGGRREEFAVIRCRPDLPHHVISPYMPGSAIGVTPGGFVIANGGHFVFHSVSGWRGHAHVGVEQLGKDGMVFGMTACDPATGRVVLRVGGVGRPHELAMFDADTNLLARMPNERNHRGAFCGPDRLLQWRLGEERTIASWRRDGTTLVRTAKADLGDLHVLDPVPLPAMNVVAVRRRTGLAWLDADTLTETDGPPGLPVTDARLLVFSLDGTLAAAAPEDTGTSGAVYDLGMCRLAALFDTSLARMVLGDMATVEAQARPELTAAVDLLRAGLAYRFGADIALGAGASAAAADDIALGGDR